MRAFLTLIVAGLAPTATSMANLDEAHFRGHLDDLRYDIRITYKPMPAFGIYQDAPKVWNVIDSMQVTLNGRAVKIPRSATADLFWPHTPQPPFRGPGKTLRFDIAGADGEYSYEATFVFSGTKLLRREKTSRTTGKTKVMTFPREQHPRPR